VLAFAYDPQPN